MAKQNKNMIRSFSQKPLFQLKNDIFQVVLLNLFSVNRKRLYLSLLSPLVLSDFISKRIFVIIASLTGVYTPGGV